jgi:hypothetical protein
VKDLESQFGEFKKAFEYLAKESILYLLNANIYDHWNFINGSLLYKFFCGGNQIQGCTC